MMDFLLAPRVPPHNFEAEQALLGTLLSNNRAIEKVTEFLRPEHFAEPVHGHIYDACRTLTSRNQIANPVTLKNYLSHDEGLKELGGDAYIARLAASAATIINAEDYGRLIFDLHLRRELIGVGEDMVNDAFEAGSNVGATELVQRVETALYGLTERNAIGSDPRSFAEIMPEVERQAKQAANHQGAIGLTTDLADLDDLIGGMAPANLLVLGARPAMGKSALAISIAHHVAKTQTPVGVFSLEMTAEEIGQRAAADTTDIPYQNIRNGRLDETDWQKVRQAIRELAELSLQVDDTQGLHIDQLRLRARRMCRRHHLGLIVIDHLHLIRGTGKDRLAQLTAISASLKEMARELSIPVLALCQLNRGLEGRDDKRPQLSDLRESGSIEQDADVVMLLHRASYYTEREEPQRKTGEGQDKFTGRLADWHDKLAREKHRADVMVLKNRHGRTGTTTLFCDLALARFRSLNAVHEGGQA